jgi:PD-(D/E)XK nuclease superfamily protein
VARALQPHPRRPPSLRTRSLRQKAPERRERSASELATNGLACSAASASHQGSDRISASALSDPRTRLIECLRPTRRAPSLSPKSRRPRRESVSVCPSRSIRSVTTLSSMSERRFCAFCKWAALGRGVLVVRCRSCRRVRNGFVRRDYDSHEIDAIAAYCGDLDTCFFLPIDRFNAQAAIQLRLAPSRNNQRLRVNWAEDFDFAARLTALLGP